MKIWFKLNKLENDQFDQIWTVFRFYYFVYREKL